MTSRAVQAALLGNTSASASDPTVQQHHDEIQHNATLHLFVLFGSTQGSVSNSKTG